MEVPEMPLQVQVLGADLLRIAISIMVIEVFTIFLPSWEVIRQHTLQKETLDSIAQWESQNQLDIAGRRSFASLSIISPSVGTGWRSADGSLKSMSGESILTMGALEHVLERNPGPLLRFSALKDFSGENIAFLTSVAHWKASMQIPTRSNRGSGPINSEIDQDILRERFSDALRLYASFISSRDAEFQINLPSQRLRELEQVFERPARTTFGEPGDINLAVPFEVSQWPTPAADIGGSEEGSEKSIAASGSTFTTDRVQYVGEIPENFSATIFDEAEKNIKYLVLTNTWPKFVKERRSSMATVKSG